MSDEERAQAEKFLSEPGHEEMHLSSLKLYEFKITNAWKGGKIGSRVRMLMEKKQEKTLNKGADVLIMSSEQLGDMIWVSPCSLSKSVKESRDNGLIDTLNEVIGIGYDVKVPGSDRLCRTAADCTAVTTHCGECDCGAPISVGAVRKHMKKLAETCSGSEGNTASCEPHQCEPYLPMCIEAQCY
ncbi:MAG: hypothetical protein KDI90_03760 [Alphaproteobacteria bacterium]|nr:hypothetical protein [Alphaproteobacteria bacterium]MCB9974191.1 hypothetical protein [Rhodospirillales bacterium]